MPEKKPVHPTLHQRILSDIEGRIVSGEWPPGYRLPFEVDLAEAYGVSRMTANKVLTKLADAGLIERRKKSGSFVAQPQVQSAILEIHDIEEEVRSMKRDYRFRLLKQGRRRASEDELSALGLAGKATILDIDSVHDAGDQPFCLESRLINLDVVPAAAEWDFSNSPPGKWLTAQVPWTAAEHKIYAVSADAAVAAALGIARGAACLVVQRRTWCDLGPVTLVRLIYPAEKHALVARFTPAQAGRS